MIKKGKKTSRSKSSSAWMHEHVNDYYVIQSKAQGYKSRAAFKLIEINEKDKIIKPGMNIVDLGSAPGSWSQVLRQILKNNGRIFALDILPMEPIEGVDFIRGDFSSDDTLNALHEKTKNLKLDLVVSDLAPNKSGNNVTDQAKSYGLADLALFFAVENLRLGGNFLVKVFQGYGYNDYYHLMKRYFKNIYIRKPKASRDKSNEVYLLGKELSDFKIVGEKTE